MKISSIRLKITNSGEDPLLGIASIEFDECLVIHDIRLIKLKSGKRIVSFPSKRVPKFIVQNNESYVEKNEFTDIVHPSNSEFRRYVEEELYKLYDAKLSEMKEGIL